jgi:hypothetical protein
MSPVKTLKNSILDIIIMKLGEGKDYGEAGFD